MMPNRLEDVTRFYQILADLEHRLEGKRMLKNCHGKMGWPKRGVYFFFEEGEQRRQSGGGLRVVRVGTMAVKTAPECSRRKFWHRLSEHKGTQKTGGGHHRTSVFRELVGYALMGRNPCLASQTWGQGSSASTHISQAEHSLEVAVSTHIRKMPFLWIEADDPPSKNSLRGYIECNSVALLSNYGKAEEEKIDPPSETWLGRYCDKDEVQKSGLWNSHHVKNLDYDPGLLDCLERLARQTPSLPTIAGQ